MKIGVYSSILVEKNLQENLEFVENLKIKYFEILNEYPNDKIDVDLLNS